MQKQGFDHDWRFYLGDPAEGNWQKQDDSTWRQVDLPHDWSIELDRAAANPSGTAGGFFPMGRGWYRKTIAAPEEWRGKKIIIEFEGVYMNAEVWLNEHFLGRHPYGYTTFTFDLTPYLIIGQQNVLRVLVDNASQVNSRWYSGSGIYRHVWLMVAEPVHIGHWGVSITTPEVSPQAAQVNVATRVENESGAAQQVTLLSRILSSDGKVAGSTESLLVIKAGEQREVAQELYLSAPRLWSPETPYLYRLETELRIGDQRMDTAETHFGIRSIHVDAEKGFLLNGQPLKMKGGCVHHDNGVMGAAAYDRSEERKVEVHKASGYNAIRTAHNPPSPAFLDACDRLGMLVIDEAFDCWREGKNPYDYHVVYDDWWQRDIDSMVLRDRNHPSVVVWSIGNEVHERDGRSNGAEVARRLAERVRLNDPTRPITSAICGTWDGNAWPVTDGVFAALDIGGYNYQFREYHSDHERHPQRVMFGTETAPKEAFENWSSVLELSYVVGDFVWTSLDYLGETGIGRVHFDSDKANFLGDYPWHQANCGDLDLCGFKRPQSYYRDILWQHGAPLYIAVHTPIPEGKTPIITYWGWPDVAANWTWPGQEGQMFTVDVYSGCEKVELLLNGKSLGIKPSGAAEKRTATFEVPYAPGELKAIGYNASQPVAECAVQTTGAPAGIRLTPDRAAIKADGADLCFVTVEVVDAAGRMHPHADQAVSFMVEGEGSLAAVGSGNPTSTESYRASQRQTYRGRCLAVVKSNGKPGEIRLHAQADGLQGATIAIHAG